MQIMEVPVYAYLNKQNYCVKGFCKDMVEIDGDAYYNVRISRVQDENTVEDFLCVLEACVFSTEAKCIDYAKRQGVKV